MEAPRHKRAAPRRFADLSPTFCPVRSSQLLTSSAVHKWGTEIHEGIYNMLMLLVELVAERVKQDPVPVNLMGVLTMVRSCSVFVPEMHWSPVTHTGLSVTRDDDVIDSLL